MAPAAVVLDDLCVLCPYGVHTPATATYTDPWGFPYRLCATHHRSLVTGLRKAEGFRPKDAPAQPRRPWRPLAPRIRRRPGDPTATGEELRRARLLVGWSLRELRDALGRSRAQLQAAEVGRRPVDPVVAAWVVRVLSGQEDEGDGPARR